MPEEALEIAERAVVAAGAGGAREAEATCTISRRFSTRARRTEIDQLEQSTGRGLTMRIFVGERGTLRRATLSTSDLTPDGIERFAQRTVEAARRVAPDPLAGIPEQSGAHGALDLGIDSADVAARTNEAKIEDALALERLTRECDARIDNSNGSYVADNAGTLGFANSSGVRAQYRYTSASRTASPVARDGDAKRTATYGTAARSWSGCEGNDVVAKRAAQRALALFGAKPIPTQKMAVVFERDVAALVLGDVFAAVNAANVSIENSYLADRLGERIGSELVTIVDDGRFHGGLGSAPFDGEGVATQRTIVCERGVLRSHLYDTYYARKLGTRSTGNASGGGVGPTNFFLEPGEGSLDQLIARTRRGILILSIIGFATESATGDYSRGASGVLIEDGALTSAVDGVTISGNFLREMLPGIDAVAGDLRFDGQIVSPSFRIAEMTVSGE
ncbi:MAG: TldD/PmbA family protein [Candidatus Eremiobacteraeota bacterium]|nr:TldD/PmbA family protein [Candidatus Eremiobacteraeota bacterium]